MDTVLARTFLEIVATGNFVRAAERLHVSQTAVSARVRTLEEQLGRKLFLRSKAGATLTPAGRRFLHYARTLIQVWERARHQVAVPSGRRALVTIGCETSLWDPLLLNWLLYMRRSAAHLALRTEVGFPESLVGQVSEGTLDIAVVYAPQQRPGLKVELLIDERLVLVTTKKSPQRGSADYVYVDWGPEFAAQHSLAFPELSNPPIYAGLGPLGREYLLAAGGSGYFRFNAVQEHIRSGRLRLVPGAPEFRYPAYAVYSDTADRKIVEPALRGLRQVASHPGPRPDGRTKSGTGRSGGRA